MNSTGSRLSIFAVVALLLQLTLPSSGDSFEDNELHDLIQLRDSTNLQSNWFGLPCNNDQSQWTGVTCSNSRVVGIAVQGMQLAGSLPSTALQNLWYLTNLNLSGNALHGPLPKLQGLIHLRAVSFARNHFSGSIPTEFLDLPNLSQLELQDNVLDGTIPPFDQEALKVFNVSNNLLDGLIPNNSVLQGFPSTSFDHNLKLCGKPLKKSCSSAPPVPPVSPAGPPASSSTNALRPWILVLVALAGAVVVFMVMFCFLFYFKRCTKKAKQQAYDPESFTGKEEKSSESIPEAKKIVDLVFFDKDKATFDLDDLMRSSAEVIGKGMLGNTFKATLETGAVAVVKRLKNKPGMSRKHFMRQMQLLGRLKHDNLVEIISFHDSKEEKLIIYEYASGGSLFQLLHDNRGGEARIPLRWDARLNIVKGIARGLAHLHQCLPSHKVPHANLKSSNVLIVHSNQYTKYHPKLTDAGFQPILPSSHIHRLAIGAVPEFSQGKKKLTRKADVYCFGLILLEVITGRAPSDGKEDLPGRVKLLVSNNRSTEVLDLEVVAEKENHADMLKLIEIAVDCTDLDPRRRPKMSDVVKRIEDIRATKETK